MRVYAGALLERPPGPRYTTRLRFAELALRGPLPRAATLERFRRSVPESFMLSFVVPAACTTSERGYLRVHDELSDALGWLGEALDALRPRVVVLPTDKRLTPGQRGRDLLADYLAALPKREGRQVAWAPTGLWESEDAAHLAGQLDVLLAADPLEVPLPPGPTAYARMKAQGIRRRLSDGVLADLVERLGAGGAPRDEVFVAIESPRSFDEASRLQGMWDARGGVAP
ncbi:MAG: DUF72 domain-containing protein [Myxococcales bacterium]|nr:DUF72 domain-containing protein [Myxococcales bacterium]